MNDQPVTIPTCSLCVQQHRDPAPCTKQPRQGEAMTEKTGIETYPVGLFRDLQQRRLRYGIAYLKSRVKARNWRAVRNYFNGYLAEWHYPPEGMQHTHCGRGWTRRAALRRLGAHIVAMNLLPREDY